MAGERLESRLQRLGAVVGHTHNSDVHQQTFLAFCNRFGHFFNKLQRLTTLDQGLIAELSRFCLSFARQL